MLLGLSIGAVGFTIWQLRNDAIKAAITDTGNIAAILAGQFSRSLYTIDMMLLELRSTSKGLNIDTPDKVRAVYGTREMRETMRAHLATLPHIFNIVIADETGQLVVSTAAWPTPDINVSDRDYFKAAQTRVDGRLSTSVPIRNRIDGNQTIVFARRLETPSGAFAGVIFASVNSNYFESIYASTQSINSLIFNLIREDGTILFRASGRRRLCRQTKLSQETTWQDALDRGTKSFRILAKADNNYRYVSVRAVPEYPLFVNISVAENTALGGLASAFGDDRPRQRRLAAVFDLPVDRDHAASPGPEQLGELADANLATARRRAEQHGARHQHVRQGPTAGHRQQAIRRHVQSQSRAR